MPKFIVVLRRIVAVSGFALVALPAVAASPPEDFGGVFWGSMLALGPGPEGPMPGPFGDPRREHGPGAPVGPDAGMPMPPMLRGLALTEEQQDKVFGILHAQAPAVRTAAKASRSAHDELSALAMSAQYDATKAKALADAEARANADLAMLRADGDHQIFMALTREQREQIQLARPKGFRP
jgi:Spy/CpxP family protein refolding chaperone